VEEEAARKSPADGSIGSGRAFAFKFPAFDRFHPVVGTEQWGMADRPTVIVTEPLTAEPLAWLGERAEVVLASTADPVFDEAAGVAEALVVRTYTTVDAALLARLPRLRVVGRAGVGLDNIDVPACEARGVAVVNTPDANTDAVVEFVLASMLDATRPRGYLDRAFDQHDWNELRADLVAPRQLAGSTLGVWGYGRIGSKLGRVAGALGMRVLYHDRAEIPTASRHGAWPVDLATLLGESDFLSVHVDGRASNRGIVSHEQFAAMKEDVVFVNTSRGFVVDAEACADFMRARPDAQALLDVHDPEPIPVEHPLLMMENVYLTPHIASATLHAKEAMSWVVRDVWASLAGSTSTLGA
jgi:phosphoglycerate dehydrogenase-like enzyme